MQTDPEIVRAAWTLIHLCSLLLQKLPDEIVVKSDVLQINEAIWRLSDVLPRTIVSEKDN